MSISASTVEPPRDQRQTILSKPFRLSLRSFFRDRGTAGGKTGHRTLKPLKRTTQHLTGDGCRALVVIS